MGMGVLLMNGGFDFGIVGEWRFLESMKALEMQVIVKRRRVLKRIWIFHRNRVEKTSFFVKFVQLSVNRHEVRFMYQDAEKRQEIKCRLTEIEFG